jgi:hypothetical protein
MTRAVLLAALAVLGALALALPAGAAVTRRSSEAGGSGETSEWRCRRATATVRFRSGS